LLLASADPSDGLGLCTALPLLAIAPHLIHSSAEAASAFSSALSGHATRTAGHVSVRLAISLAAAFLTALTAVSLSTTLAERSAGIAGAVPVVFAIGPASLVSLLMVVMLPPVSQLPHPGVEAAAISIAGINDDLDVPRSIG
jgi:hypothetical protein